MSLVNFIPGLIMLFVIGSYSDRLGRKIALITPCFGSICGILLQMAIVYFDLPVWVFLFGVVEYLFGGLYAVFTGCFAYIADTVPQEKRALRMTILDATVFFMAAAGNLVVGYMIQWMGYFYPYIFCLVGKIITLLYGIFFIPESLQTKHDNIEKGKPSRLGPCQNISRGLKIFIVDNGTNRRWQLLLFMLLYFIAEIIDYDDIIILFELNAPLCWDSVMIGYYGAATDMVKGQLL